MVEDNDPNTHPRDSLDIKTARNSTNGQNKRGVTNKPRPEIRNDLESRSQKEDGFRGDKSKKGDKAKAQKK